MRIPFFSTVIFSNIVLVGFAIQIQERRFLAETRNTSKFLGTS